MTKAIIIERPTPTELFKDPEKLLAIYEAEIIPYTKRLIRIDTEEKILRLLK